jgi:hypothetical protein
MPVLMAATLSIVSPAHGQIAPEMDGNKLVYVNAATAGRAGGRNSGHARAGGPAAGYAAAMTGGGTGMMGNSNVRLAVDRLVESSARRNGLDPALVRAVVRAESDNDPAAISPKGARGLMQLMPATAKRFGVEDAFDATANLDGGARYLRWLLNRYSGDLARSLAAYNAGETAMDWAVAQDRRLPPYAETRTYVARVMASYELLSGQPVSQRGAQTSLTATEPAKRTIRRETNGRGGVVFTNE